MIIPLTIFATLLVAASVGISVLNWASMPAAGTWATYVAASIAFGVEGAKLFLVPYGFHIFKKNVGLAWTSWLMGAVMTVVSVGGIVIWLDANLSLNAAAKADVAQVAKINQARIDIATTMIQFDRASKADKVLDKVDIQQPTGKAMGLTIPFDMSSGGRWGLLLSIALTIDLGALLLITIITMTVEMPVMRKKKKLTVTGTRQYDGVYEKNLLNKEKCDTRAGADAASVESHEWRGATGVRTTHQDIPDTPGGPVYAHPEEWEPNGPDLGPGVHPVSRDELISAPPPPPPGTVQVMTNMTRIVLKPREEELKAKILMGDYGEVLPSANKISKEFRIRPASVRTVVAFLSANGKLEKTDDGLTLCEKAQTTEKE